ncbi:MAG: L-threonylcarbamoyladenylate synthase [Bacteroidota bacterium]|nr:L-threonylcarbamoyladenylate synthase [Bacteroidota bacterium]
MAKIGKDIKKAKELLENGELVAIPTETVYGLAANALNADAVAGIFTAKNRPEFDPLIVHIPSVANAGLYVRDIPEKAHTLANAFWPGPLTLVLDRKPVIPDLVTAGLSTVGIRSPNHPLTRALLEQLDFPLAAPSANPFGYISPTTAQHVQNQLGDKIRYILDGGACMIGIESTIVGFHNGDGVVLRTGGLKIEDIEAVIGKVKLQINSSSNPKSPGQLQSHYAPRKEIIIGNLEELIQAYSPASIDVLSFRTDHGVPSQVVLSPAGNLEEAARNFFAALRQLDESPTRLILAEYLPDEGLGRAINDRLKRAAGLKI